MTPPDDLGGFPTVDEPGPLHRIHRRDRRPFWFASAGPDDADGGRYDLPAPDGTCHLATEPIGAFLEVFRQPGLLISEVDLRGRSIHRAEPPAGLALADLTDRGTRRFGLTGDIHTTPDRGTTRRWAAALRRAGHLGLRGLVRHDPAQRTGLVALFGPAGDETPRGWSGGSQRLAVAHDLLAEAQALGFRFAAEPDAVEYVDP